MIVTMLTTVDNPYDPFTQYDAWEAEDERLSQLKGIQTCNQMLARMTITSDELDEDEQRIANETAITRILELNPLGAYRKVTKEF